MFTLPAPLRHALFVLFIGGILAYGAAFAGYLLVNFDLLNLLRDVVTQDDAFYYYQIAYHLSEGQFSTFDGGISRTNGYHPIWLLLITPFYWIFDKEGALFAIKALEIMLIAGGVALIAAAAWLARLAWYLLFALLPMLYQQRSLLLGLEAAAALFMLGLLFLALLLYARNPERWRWTWPLAVVAFALPWVRLEYIAISLTATTALLLLEWLRQERPAGASWQAVLTAIPSRRTFAPIIGAVAGILTYFAYNKLVFGGIVPVSGAAKRVWSQAYFEEEGGYNLLQNFQAIRQIEVFHNEVLLTALAVCAGFLLLGWLAHRSRNREDWLLLAFLVGVFSLAAGHLAKFAETVLYVDPGRGGFSWYFVPAYLLLVLVVPLICYATIHFLRRCSGPQSARVSKVISVAILALGAVLLFTKADFAGPFRYVDEHRQATHLGWGFATYMGMPVVNQALPEDSVIGSWDAGVIGYLSRFPVVNLDGLVNSYDYLHRKTNVERYGKGTWKEKFMPVYRELGVTHVANISPASRSEDTMLFAGPPFSGSDKVERQFQLWSVEPTEGVDPAAWFWQRMEPHFDYQADGVGLLVDGRAGQAFAPGCPPDGEVGWDWSGAGPDLAPQPWTRTQTGLCVAATVLPPEATPPVRIKTAAPGDYRAYLVGDRQPAISADFDVYLTDNTLVYVKEPCARADTEATFFLALYPVEVNDLPGPRQQHGFDSRDFNFDRQGNSFRDFCWAVVPLPEYAIATISTGQYVPVEGGFEHLWEGEFLWKEGR